jgi:hypothetical protein
LGNWDNGLLVPLLAGLTREFINELFPFKNNPAKDGIFDFPIFHHSIIFPPWRDEAKTLASKNTSIFPA